MRMPIKEYHKLPHISNSDLSLINKSINHYLLKEEKETSEAQAFGQAVHDKILSPDVFDSQYVIIPDEIKVKRGKEWEIFCLSNKDKVYLKKDDYEKIQNIYSSVMNHPKAAILLKDGEAEETFIWNQDGIDRKCRPDYRNPKYRCLIDLKTTTSAMIDDFARSVAAYRYYVQAAWYLDGVNFCLRDKEPEYENFIFIAIESKSPYSVSVFDLGRESIEEGRRQYRKDLAKYIEYLNNVDNPEYYKGISKDILTIQLPTWAFYKNMDLN